MYLESNREEDALAEYLAWSQMDGSSREPLMKAAKFIAIAKTGLPPQNAGAFDLYQSV